MSTRGPDKPDSDLLCLPELLLCLSECRQEVRGPPVSTTGPLYLPEEDLLHHARGNMCRLVDLLCCLDCFLFRPRANDLLRRPESFLYSPEDLLYRKWGLRLSQRVSPEQRWAETPR